MELYIKSFLISVILIESLTHGDAVTLLATTDYSPCSYVSNLQMIDCTAPSFTEIPNILSTAAKPVRVVKIEFSEILRIPKLFDGIKETLEEFYISSSRITEISPFAFENLNQLRRLSITSDDDRSMTVALSLKQLLAPMNKLESVLLSGLNIEDVESDFLTSNLVREFHLKKISNPISFHSHSFRIGGESLEKFLLTQITFKLPNSNFSQWLEHLVNVKELHFENCQITKLPELPTTLLQLQFLNLDKNHIDDFSSCFRLAYVKNSLKKLKFSDNNKLKSNDLACLNTLTNLEVLDLKHNSNLGAVPPVLQVLRKVHTLILDNCGIKQIDSANFVPDILKILSLSGNPLEYVDSRAFEILTKLETLILDNVNLPSTMVDTYRGVWDKVFEKLSALKTLSMVNCQLSDSVWNSLSNLRSTGLESLFLDDNQITTLQSYFFVSFQNVTELGLSNNQIAVLPNGSLYGLPADLKSLKLNNNEIESLYKCEFFHFQSYSGLQVLNNPIICDCRIKWLVENSTKGYTENVLCSGPPSNPSNAGKFLTKIPLSELYCDDKSISQPICSTTEVFTPPIISTTRPGPSGDFVVKLLPMYLTESSSLLVTIKFSDDILKTFNSAQLQYQSNKKPLTNLNIPVLSESKVEIQSVSYQESFQMQVILIDEGSAYSYSYNNMTYTTPNSVGLAGQVIGGIVAGVVVFILIIIGLILLFVFLSRRDNRNHVKYRNDRADVISTTTTKMGEDDSVYDYDYPELDRTPKQFVRASTRSTVLSGISQETINGPSQNGMTKSQHVSFYPMYPPNSSNRQTQSTSNLPHISYMTRQAPTSHRQQSYDPKIPHKTSQPSAKSNSAGILNPACPISMISRDLPALPDQASPSDIYPYERVDYNSSYLGMTTKPNEDWPSDGKTSPPPLPPPRHLDMSPLPKISHSGLSRSDAILEHDRSQNNFPNPTVTRRSMEDSQQNSLFSDVYEGQNPAFSYSSNQQEMNSQTTLADVKDIGYF